MGIPTAQPAQSPPQPPPAQPQPDPQKTTGSAATAESGLTGTLDLLKRAAEASLIFGALLYVIGWSYLDGYYTSFGLRVGQLGVSNQEAAMASFKFIFHSIGSTLLFCSGTLVLGIGVGYFYRQLGARRELVTITFLLILLCLAGLLSRRSALFGQERAWSDMSARTTTLPLVELELDRTKVSDNLIHYKDMESKKYLLLLQATDRLWLFRATTDTFKGVLSVVTLPKEALRVMTIERATPSGGDQ
jgi:hypothetical protein